MAVTAHTLDDGRQIKLGRSAPSPADERDLELSQFLRAPHELPSPPAANDYISYVVSGFSSAMFGNDRYGDCVFASSGHRTMVQSALSGKQAMPTEAELLAAYAAVTGFDPATGANDN